MEAISDIAVRVLFDDGRYIAVDKPSGLLVVPGRGARRGEPTLDRLVSEQLGLSRLWPVHRIDRETSGLVLFALTEAAHRAANRAFTGRQVSKRYVAFCEGLPEPPSGYVDAPLAPDPRRKRRGCTVVSKEGRPSRTRYAVQARLSAGQGAAVDAWPETGRTHQIRVHMAHLGHPLLQDERYGRVDESVPLKRLALHAAELSIPSLGLELSTELPPDMAALIAG